MGRDYADRMFAIIRLCLLTCVAIVFTRNACGEELIYTFSSVEDGGVVLVSVDPVAGSFGTQRILFRDPSLRNIRKLALWHGADGARVVGATVEGPPPGNLVLIPIPPAGETRPASAPIRLDVPGDADEIRSTRQGFLVGGTDGWLVHAVIDGAKASIASSLDLKSALTPSGSRTEDIRVRSDGDSAWVTLQKDSKDGSLKGHRLVRVALPDLRVLSDLPFGRSRPEHHPPKGQREKGPSPEIVLEDPSSNTVIVTLDNYGAVLLADLNAALDGRWANESHLSTALDGAFGASYPDRAVIVPPRHVKAGATIGASRILVANAGRGGGAVVIDLVKRARVGEIACRAGLESLTLIEGSDLIVAAAAGKRKERSENGAVKRLDPSPELVIFDLSRGESVCATVIPAEGASASRWVSGFRRGPEIVAVERVAETERDRLALLRIGRTEDGGATVKHLAVIDALAPVQRVIEAPSAQLEAAVVPSSGVGTSVK